MKTLKKKTIISLIFILALFMVIPFINVRAGSVPITLTQADFDEAKSSGTAATPTSKGLWYYVNGSDKLFILGRNTDYVLEGDITLDSGDGDIELVNNNLTLNNATITGGIKTESSTNNTLSGTGTVGGYVSQYGGSLTVNGAIVFNKLFNSQNANTTIINGGTFNNGFMASRNTDVTINNATINTGTDMSNAIQVDRYSTIVINNATVTAYNVALASDEEGDVTIKGGTFTGGTAGLFVANGTCKLSGGTFKTNGTSDVLGKNGAIIIGENLTFDGMLVDDYKYSTSTDYSTSSNEYISLKYLNAREISVVKQYTVTFNTNGGGSVASQTVNDGGKATRPTTNPTKDGFTFDDWYTDDTYTTKFDFTNNTITTDTTIYAKFIQNTTNNNENTDNTSTTDTTNNNNTNNSTENKSADNKSTGTNSTDTKNTEKATENNSNNPKTGDNIAVWISLMIVSVLGVIGTVKYTKKIKIQ